MSALFPDERSCVAAPGALLTSGAGRHFMQTHLRRAIRRRQLYFVNDFSSASRPILLAVALIFVYHRSFL